MGIIRLGFYSEYHALLLEREKKKKEKKAKHACTFVLLLTSKPDFDNGWCEVTHDGGSVATDMILTQQMVRAGHGFLVTFSCSAPG